MKECLLKDLPEWQYQYSSCCECECCSANCTCNGPTTVLVCNAWTYPQCPVPLPAGRLNETCRIDVCNATAVPSCAAGRVFQNSDGSQFTVLNFVDPCNANCRWDDRCQYTIRALCLSRHPGAYAECSAILDSNNLQDCAQTVGKR